MKTFAIVLLCAFAAVQGRSGVLKSTRSEAEAPWVVHLRSAVSTSGLLTSCVGSLIDNQWVLTTGTCLRNTRFIWVRYGAKNVFQPSLVTENSAVRNHPILDLSLISINRVVHTTEDISIIPLATKDTEVPESASFCGYGENDVGGPGEKLGCFGVTLKVQEDGVISAQSEDGEATEYDIGAPLVADGVQVGILISGAEEGSVGKFIAVAEALDWIESETGLPLGGSRANNDAVNFIN